MPPPDWRSYEELAEDLMRRLGAANGTTTLRLERDVLLSGRATENRIDVLWEFQQASGQLMPTGVRVPVLQAADQPNRPAAASSSRKLASLSEGSRSKSTTVRPKTPAAIDRGSCSGTAAAVVAARGGSAGSDELLIIRYTTRLEFILPKR